MNQKQQSKAAFTEQYAEMVSERHSGTDRTCSDSLAPAKSLGYSEDEIKKVPEGAVQLGLGCGNPTALAELQQGQVVLDLGSGGGLDVFIAAQKVGPEGKAIGVDMTPEMVEKATRFAREGGHRNVEFKVGQLEQLPIADESIDIIISNCVINHSSDKPAVFKEAFRVLKRNGRMYVCDLAVEGEPPRTNDPGMEVWAEWLTVACGKQEYLDAIREAGFNDIAVAECRYDGPGMIPALAGRIISLQVKAQKQSATL